MRTLAYYDPAAKLCPSTYRTYTSQGRAEAAARRLIDQSHPRRHLLGPRPWWRVVYVGCGDWVIDTISGYVAEGSEV